MWICYVWPEERKWVILEESWSTKCLLFSRVSWSSAHVLSFAKNIYKRWSVWRLTIAHCRDLWFEKVEHFTGKEKLLPQVGKFYSPYNSRLIGNQVVCSSLMGDKPWNGEPSGDWQVLNDLFDFLKGSHYPLTS